MLPFLYPIQQQKEMERKRRQEGAELVQAKRDIAERQARQLSDEIAKQKAEVKAARQKVRIRSFLVWM